LHTFQDDGLGGNSDSFHHLDVVTVGLHRSIELQRSKLPELTANLTYKSWAGESHEIAETFAYKNGNDWILAAHKDHEHDDGPLVIPPFPENYKVTAKTHAQRRVTMAGYRLADKLNAIFPPNP